MRFEEGNPGEKKWYHVQGKDQDNTQEKSGTASDFSPQGWKKPSSSWSPAATKSTVNDLKDERRARGIKKKRKGREL